MDQGFAFKIDPYPPDDERYAPCRMGKAQRAHHRSNDHEESFHHPGK